MRHRHLLVVVTLALLIWSGQTFSTATLADDPLPAVMSAAPATQSTESGLTLSWRLPDYAVETIRAEGEQYSQISLAGLPLSDEPGYPRLPFYSALIGLPPSGGAGVRIVEIETETIELTQPVLPALTPYRDRNIFLPGEAPPTGGQTILAANQTAYAKNALYPADAVMLDAPDQIRFNRVARLTINPVRVNSAAGKAIIVRAITVEIIYEQSASETVALKTQSSRFDPFGQALGLSLLNPEGANWTVDTRQPPSDEETASRNSPPLGGIEGGRAAGDAIKVIVEEKGLYALTYAELQAAGLPVDSLDPQTFSLAHGPPPREEIAVTVEGEGDGSFDPADRILFYAAPTFSRYTDEDVYFLDYGGTAGPRIASRSGDPSGLPAGVAWITEHAEENNFYDSLYPAHNGDHFFWEELRTIERPSYLTFLLLSNPLTATTTPSATLTMWLQSEQNPWPGSVKHRVAASINNSVVGEKAWDYDKAIQTSYPVTASLLLPGVNTMVFSLPNAGGGDIEYAWIDAYALTYATERGSAGQFLFSGEAGQNAYTLQGWATDQLTVYNVSQPNSPQQVNGVTIAANGGTFDLSIGDADAATAQYLVVPEGQLKSALRFESPKDLTDPAAGADYIIITHPDFLGAVAPLVTQKEAAGLRVATFDVEAIYDTFGAGRMDAGAIKTFLQNAYNTWPGPVPMYVVLVGDGHYDFKNYLNITTNNGGPWPNKIPPNLVNDIDPWLGETASDSRLVDVSGVGSGKLPDMIIGRLPVNTVDETNTVVGKIVNYQTSPPPGNWNSRQVFVADNPDYAGNFYNDSDAAYVRWNGHPSLVGERFYYSIDPANTDPYFYDDPVVMRNAFLANFNQGMGMVTYHGHSSWHQWGVEQFLRWSITPAENDVLKMTNGDRLPVVLQMTCFTGFFHEPEYPTLDEAMLRQPGGGAVSIWGSTGEGVATGQNVLQSGFYDAVIDQAETNFGAATISGKLKLYANGFNQDLIDTFNILGDPGLVIDFNVVNFTDFIYLPVVLK